MDVKAAKQTRFKDLAVGQEFKVQMETLNWEDERSRWILQAVKIQPYNGYNCLGRNGNGYKIGDNVKVTPSKALLRKSHAKTSADQG